MFVTFLFWMAPPFSESKLHSSRDFHILFVPRRSMLCEQRLKEQGVLASFTNIDEYILDLIPYDGDLLSMEYESAFRVGLTHIVYWSVHCSSNVDPHWTLTTSELVKSLFILFHSGVLLGKWPNKPVPHSQGPHDLTGTLRYHSTDFRQRRLCTSEYLINCA